MKQPFTRKRKSIAGTVLSHKNNTHANNMLSAKSYYNMHMNQSALE